MVDSSFASRVAVLADAQVCHRIHCLSTKCCTCIYFLNRFFFCCVSVFVAPGRNEYFPTNSLAGHRGPDHQHVMGTNDPQFRIDIRLYHLGRACAPRTAWASRRVAR